MCCRGCSRTARTEITKKRVTGVTRVTTCRIIYSSSLIIHHCLPVPFHLSSCSFPRCCRRSGNASQPVTSSSSFIIHHASLSFGPLFPQKLSSAFIGVHRRFPLSLLRCRLLRNLRIKEVLSPRAPCSPWLTCFCRLAIRRFNGYNSGKWREPTYVPDCPPRIS